MIFPPASQPADEPEVGEAQLRAAQDAGLPEGLASRLRGGTAEELRADAEGLKLLLAEHERPRTPSFDGGARTSMSSPPPSMDRLIRAAKGIPDRPRMPR
jgi:hypothetical protein